MLDWYPLTSVEFSWNISYGGGVPGLGFDFGTSCVVADGVVDVAASWGLEFSDLVEDLQLRLTFLEYAVEAGALAHGGYVIWQAPGETLEQYNENSGALVEEFSPSPLVLTLRPAPGTLQFFGPGGEIPATSTNYRILIEAYVDIDVSPEGCFWDGIVMAVEDCEPSPK